jgi:hypothetical protein
MTDRGSLQSRQGRRQGIQCAIPAYDELVIAALQKRVRNTENKIPEFPKPTDSSSKSSMFIFLSYRITILEFHRSAAENAK